MLQTLQHLLRIVESMRERESAQRNFLRGIYEGPSHIPVDYERPAYLRRPRLAGR